MSARKLTTRKVSQVPLKYRVAWQQVAFFVLIHALAIAALFFPSWEGLALAAVFHFVTGGLGISFGYHRLLTHRAIAVAPVVRRYFAICGVLALQGGPLRWAAMHRSHHRYTDQPGDPHARSRGFVWSHCGWIFLKAPNGYRFRSIEKQVPDLAKDPVLCFLERHYLAVNVASWMLALVVLGWELTLWAVFLRIVFVWHCTWLVNSLCHEHLPSGETAASTDGLQSGRNLRFVAFLTYGEGLHKTHHQRPQAVTFGSFWDGDLIGNLLPPLLKLVTKRGQALP